MQYDGSINIETKIDTDGFNKGMKGAAKSASKVLDAIARGQAKWVKMTWGDQEKAILKTIALYGDLWNAMDYKAQRAAIHEVIGTIQEATEATQQLNEAGTDFDKIGSGLGKIMSALVPSTYRIRRATKGMNELTKASSGNLFVLFASVAAVAAVIAVLALGFIALGKAVWSWAERMTQSLYNSLSPTSAMRQEVDALQSGFEAVKGSIHAMGATLLSALAPTILKIIGYLIQMINFVSMFIASLTGAEYVMQYVSGAADDAAGGAGKFADETERANKAAKGALAAFDQLNVLAQDKGAAGGGGGIPGGDVELKRVKVPVDFAKDKWQEFLDWWDAVVKPAFVASWEDMKEDFKKSTKEKWESVKATVRRAFIALIQLASLAGIAMYLRLKNSWERIKKVWGIAKEWFRINVTNPIKEKFKTALNSIKTAWTNTFDGIRLIIKSKINIIIGFLNAMIAGLISGINVAIRALNKLEVSFPSWFPGGLGGQKFGFDITQLTAPQIPLLATGAVIPPNAPFAAILGDQRSGKNIEAPENLIRQIIQEEIGQIQGEFTFNFEGTMGTLVREMKPYLDRENVRIGDSLAKRSTA